MRGAKDAAEAVVHRPAAVVPEPSRMAAGRRAAARAAQGEQVHAQAPAPRQLEIGPPSGGTQPSSWTAWPS